MKLLKRVANPARNAFDMSHRHLITANYGELLPITFIETVPEDYIELSVADLLRAAPMVTSPFMRAKQHIDVYYVPYCDMWTNFESFMTLKSEPKHSNMRSAAVVPHASIYDMYMSTQSFDSEDDVVGMDYITGALKIMDLCGYGRIETTGEHSDHPKVNLWRLAAYNKIWYEHYRQQYYDNGLRFLSDGDFRDGVANPAVLFNFDDLKCSSEAEGDVINESTSQAIDNGNGYYRMAEMLQMRYRLWKKDLFTGLMPSAQFGNVSSVPFDLDLVSMDTFGLNVSGDATTNNTVLGCGPSSTRVVQKGTTATGTVYNNEFNVLDSMGNPVGIIVKNDADGGSLDILSLRKAEALQIWREAALTAGNRIADNMRAHYGADAEYAMHESQLIGSVSAPLNISDVNATAQTGSSTNQALGDVAGKGISTLDDKVIKFKAKKFGVIVVMFSLLPEAEYQSDGVDRMNQLLEHEDYFVPEYQDLGLEPVSSLDFFNIPVSQSKVLGYAPRYIGYKQKIDKCFRGFKQGDVFAPWASPKTDVTTALANPSNSLPLKCLYVNPALFDRNFVNGANLSAQFICDFFFDCSKVSNMSVSGLPRF